MDEKPFEKIIEKEFAFLFEAGFCYEYTYDKGSDSSCVSNGFDAGPALMRLSIFAPFRAARREIRWRLQTDSTFFRI